MSIKINDNEIKKVYLMKAGTNEFIKQNKLFLNENVIFKPGGWSALLVSPFYDTSFHYTPYCVQDDDFIYVAFKTYYYKYNKATEEWTKISMPIQSYNQRCNGLILNNNFLYACTQYNSSSSPGLILKYDLTNSKGEVYLIEDKHINSIDLEDNILRYSLFNKYAIYQYNMNTLEYTTTLSTNNANQYCYKIIHDNNYIYSSGSSMTFVLIQKSDNSVIKYSEMGSILEQDENNVYFGYYGTLKIFNKSTKTTKSIVLGNSSPYPNLRAAVNYNNILYIGCDDNNIYKYDKIKETVECISEIPGPFSSESNGLQNMIFYDDTLYVFGDYGEFAKFNL